MRTYFMSCLGTNVLSPFSLYFSNLLVTYNYLKEQKTNIGDTKGEKIISRKARKENTRKGAASAAPLCSLREKSIAKGSPGVSFLASLQLNISAKTPRPPVLCGK